MSQYIPYTAIRSVPPRIASGIADQAGMPETRSENATSCFIGRRRPLRCPATSHSIAKVATIAPVVAAITCPMAAPAAGFVEADANAAGAATRLAASEVRTAVAVLAGLGMRRLLRSLRFLLVTNRSVS